MGFFDSISDGFTSVFSGVKDFGSGVFDKVLKPIGEKAWSFGQKALDRVDRIGAVGDKAIGAAGNVVEGAGNVAQGLGNLLSGNSNILVYLGIGLVAVMVVPKIIDKVL